MQKKLVLSLLVFSLFMTGCYLNDEVETNQMAVQLDENTRSILRSEQASRRFIRG